MDALLTCLVGAALAEWGDKTQLVVALLAARSGRPLLVLIGLFAAALASSVAAAYAGAFVNDAVTIRAMSLLVGFALLFGGVTGLFLRGQPAIGSERWPVVIASFILCLAAEMGDRSQFLTFALSARFDLPALAAAGATAGIVAAAVPAALLGDRFLAVVPMRPIRIAIAILFLVSGFYVAVTALQLA